MFNDCSDETKEVIRLYLKSKKAEKALKDFVDNNAGTINWTVYGDLMAKWDMVVKYGMESTNTYQ